MKRRRDGAAFKDMDTDGDGPVPAGQAPFSAAEVEVPDNPMNVEGLWYI